MADFEKAFKHILKVEGEAFTDHPADRGGPTKFGITLKTYQGSHPTATLETIKNLTRDDAKLFYVEQFWKPIKGHTLISDEIALFIFDQSVNRGLHTAIKNAQEVLGLTSDGIIGPKTLMALQAVNVKTFILDFYFKSQERYLAIVKQDASQIIFLKGWMNRLNGLLKTLIV